MNTDKGAEYEIALYMQALTDANKGRYTRASSALRTLRGLYPKSVKVLVWSARCEPNLDFAHKFLERAHDLDPDNLQVYEAWQYVRQGGCNKLPDTSLVGQFNAAVNKLYPLIIAASIFIFALIFMYFK